MRLPFLIFMLTLDVALAAQAPPSATRELGIKYFRDSEEYATLSRQVYRLAGAAVERARRTEALPWAVVLDVDETTLANSWYQVERAVYGFGFETDSWSEWVQRRQAPAVPGAKAFIDRVRAAGGRVAYISNRDASLMEATRANLASLGLWSDEDRLCLAKPNYNKSARRAEVVKGSGECGWANTPMRVLAFIGDQMGDFPEAAEAIPGTGTDEAFGVACFLLPNPMYGSWTSRVTRQR